METVEPEPADIWLKELLENVTQVFVENVNIANNYWGSEDQTQIADLIMNNTHSTTIARSPYETSSIVQALPILATVSFSSATPWINEPILFNASADQSQNAD